jgi:arylsulfatase A-like enzyme
MSTYLRQWRIANIANFIEAKISRTRRAVPALLLVALALFAIGCDRPEPASSTPEPTPAPARPAPPRPAAKRVPRIVILISLDTLRADHLGSYGSARFTSPVLDGIAREGVVFDDASATAPWTLPSHASMLTGLHPNEHGVTTQWRSLPEDISTLQGVLSRRGFRTAAVVNSTLLRQRPYQVTRGFDEFVWIEEGFDHREPSRHVTDRAIAHLSRSDRKPLFLFVHYYDVHSDYVSLPGYERLFVDPYSGIADGSTLQLFYANLNQDYADRCREDFDSEACTVTSGRVIDASTPKIRYTAADVRHLESLYDAGVRQLDTELGRLFSHLRTSGKLDEALVVVTSDHGESFGEHGAMEHGFDQHQEVLRVPLIIRGPGIPRGKRIDAPVSLVDVMPTILAQLQIMPPGDGAGLDLAPLWQGDRPEAFATRRLYGESPIWIHPLVGNRLMRSVREGNFKLHFDALRGTHALYDLSVDPGEATDISQGYPELTARLVAHMKERYPALPPEREGIELDENDVDRLRALGYEY